MKINLEHGKAYVFRNAAHDDDSSYVFDCLDRDGNGVFTELRHEWTDGSDEEIGTVCFDEYQMSLLVPAPQIEKHWYLIEDMTSSHSEVYDTILNAENQNDALNKATAMWDAQSKSDRAKTDDAYIGYADTDDDGCIDYDSMTDIVYIQYHKRPVYYILRDLEGYGSTAPVCVTASEASDLMRGWYAMDANAPSFDEVWREATQSEIAEYGISNT